MKLPILKFDRTFFRDFWSLLTPYWTSEEKGTALGYLALSLLCTIISVCASVAFNECNKNFFDALQNFNKAALTTSLLQFGVIVIVLLLSYGYAFYFNGLISIRWRRWLTKNFLHAWLNNHTHYRMQQFNHTVDNPDQRICEDLDNFPDKTLSIFFMLVQASLTLMCFGYILCQSSGSITLPLNSFHLVIPAYLLWGALLYGVVGTTINGWIGKKLANLDYQQQHFNADFRYSLIRLREANPTTADESQTENQDKSLQSFQPIFSNFLQIITLKKHLTFFVKGYNTTAMLLGMILSLPLYLQKQVQLGGMMQISGAFASVVGAFSIFVTYFSLLAEWRAVIHRLAEFKKLINLINHGSETDRQNIIPHGIQHRSAAIAAPPKHPV